MKVSKFLKEENLNLIGKSILQTITQSKAKLQLKNKSEDKNE